MTEAKNKRASGAKVTKKTAPNTPIYKKWWFWVIIVLLIIGIGGSSASEKKDASNDNNSSTSESKAEAKDFTNQDAKQAYEDLSANGYNVKFVFDRNNNGGFTEDSFQEFVKNSFSSSYEEMPFLVTKQEVKGNDVVLYIEYKTSVEEDKKKAERESKLAEKLDLVDALTACEIYGKQNYRNFKVHSIVGKIAEYATDDDTWLLKYYVDADGYKNKNMECYVTGTSSNPIVTDFLVY